MRRRLRGQARAGRRCERERKAVAVAGHPSSGPADAPVTIVAFSDFECPYCIKGRATSRRSAASHPGKVRVVFRNMPLPMHAEAEPAAIAAFAAHRQGKFWEMHDALFATQGKFAVDDLDALADEIGLDIAHYRSDIADPALAAALKRDVDDAKTLGVRGTPSFFVNGRLVVGARPAERAHRARRRRDRGDRALRREARRPQRPVRRDASGVVEPLSPRQNRSAP